VCTSEQCLVTDDDKIALVDLGMVGHLPVRTQERLLELQRVANRVACSSLGIGRREAGDPDRQRRPQVAAPPDLTSDLDKAPETAIRCLTRAWHVPDTCLARV
jgi:hypothetical protein